MGRELGFRSFPDDYGNVIIDADPAPGQEKAPRIILQAHMDMVTQAGPEAEKDPARDAVEWYLDDGWIQAKDTTLGADDGIGMAAALAYLDQVEDRPFTRLIFTRAEEANMDGAKALDPDLLDGDFLLNLDSEQEGVAIDASPGSVHGAFHLPLEREALPEDWSLGQIVLGGLRGGHSGVAILDVHTNAIKSLSDLLRKLPEELDFRLVSFQAGLASNVIPDSARAVVAFPSQSREQFQEALEEVGGKVKEILLKSDPDTYFEMTEIPERLKPMTRLVGQKVLSLLESLPHGVQELSEDKSRVVTSTNLAMVACEENSLSFDLLSRSLLYTSLEEVKRKILEIIKVFQAEGGFAISYPIWEAREDSLLRKAYRKVYLNRFGEEAVVQPVHTGLECSIFSKKNPDLDILSIGPTIEKAHTPLERLDAASCVRYFDLLCDLVKEISSRTREEAGESV